jgi:uncharacterized membrane protein
MATLPSTCPEVRVDSRLTIRRTPAELSALFRRLDVLQRILTHVDRITALGPCAWRWTTMTAAGRPLAWDVTSDVGDETAVAWHSVPDAPLECEGRIAFAPGPDGSTDLSVSLRYRSADPAVAEAIASTFGADPARQVDRDFYRLKEQVESGRLPAKDVVEQSSEDSFPASDPPAWAGR